MDLMDSSVCFDNAAESVSTLPQILDAISCWKIWPFANSSWFCSAGSLSPDLLELIGYFGLSPICIFLISRPFKSGLWLRPLLKEGRSWRRYCYRAGWRGLFFEAASIL
jgi:hypothetical protein